MSDRAALSGRGVESAVWPMSSPRPLNAEGGLTAGEDQHPGEGVTDRVVESRRIPATPGRPPAVSPTGRAA